MSDNLEELKESLKLNIQGSVKESFDTFLNEAAKDEDDDEEMSEADDEDDSDEEVSESEDSDSESNEDDEEDDDSESEDEDDEEMDEGKKSRKKLKESMSVQATKVNGRGRSGTETLDISRMSDLVKLANSRKYEYFTVRKRNGQEDEYHVDFTGGKPKLVKM